MGSVGGGYDGRAMELGEVEDIINAFPDVLLMQRTLRSESGLENSSDHFFGLAQSHKKREMTRDFCLCLLQASRNTVVEFLFTRQVCESSCSDSCLVQPAIFV